MQRRQQGRRQKMQRRQLGGLFLVFGHHAQQILEIHANPASSQEIRPSCKTKTLANSENSMTILHVPRDLAIMLRISWKILRNRQESMKILFLGTTLCPAYNANLGRSRDMTTTKCKDIFPSGNSNPWIPPAPLLDLQGSHLFLERSAT